MRDLVARTAGPGFLAQDTKLAADGGHVLDFPVANRIVAHPFKSSAHSHRPLDEQAFSNISRCSVASVFIAHAVFSVVESGIKVHVQDAANECKYPAVSIVRRNSCRSHSFSFSASLPLLA